MTLERIQSKIWGIVPKATPAQRATIDHLVHTFPADVYESMNAALGQRGLRLGIGTVRANQPAELTQRPDMMSDPSVSGGGPVG